MKNKSNITKYRVLSKVYDMIFSKALGKGRAKSLALLEFKPNAKVLLIGVGTGLDIPLIPENSDLMGIDLSTSMLEVAREKYAHRQAEFIEMNAEELTFDDSEFDIVILSLILSVVEHPDLALKEALRVMKHEGQLLVYDKFSENEITLGRKVLNLITSAVGTDITRSFYKISKGLKIKIKEDMPVMYGGNYRAILVSKASDD